MVRYDGGAWMTACKITEWSHQHLRAITPPFLEGLGFCVCALRCLGLCGGDGGRGWSWPRVQPSLFCAVRGSDRTERRPRGPAVLLVPLRPCPWGGRMPGSLLAAGRARSSRVRRAIFSAGCLWCVWPCPMVLRGGG